MAIEQGNLYRHDFGPRQNHLQEGPRPVVVVQTDVLNKMEGYSNVIVVPITTKQKQSPTYASIQPSADNGLRQTSWAIANQIFTMDKEELKDSLGKVSKEELYAIKQALKLCLAI